MFCQHYLSKTFLSFFSSLREKNMILIIIFLLYCLIQSSLATDDMGVQDKSVLESATTDRAHFAWHNTTLEPFMSTQGCCSLICFSAPVALIFDIAYNYSSLFNILGFVDRWMNETLLIPR